MRAEYSYTLYTLSEVGVNLNCTEISKKITAAMEML